MARALISPRTMAALRVLDQSAMPDTATLVRPGVPLSNGRGGTIPTPPTTRTLVGRFAHGSGDGVGQQGPPEDDREELIRRGATARFRVATTEDVAETDQLLFGGERYGVVYAPTPTAYSSSRLIGLKLLGPA